MHTEAISEPKSTWVADSKKGGLVFDNPKVIDAIAEVAKTDSSSELRELLTHLETKSGVRAIPAKRMDAKDELCKTLNKQLDAAPRALTKIAESGALSEEAKAHITALAQDIEQNKGQYQARLGVGPQKAAQVS